VQPICAEETTYETPAPGENSAKIIKKIPSHGGETTNHPMWLIVVMKIKKSPLSGDEKGKFPAKWTSAHLTGIKKAPKVIRLGAF
jgi:hypothetical protein